jgi:uncharacterized lipoprotein YbaY
MHVLKNDSPCDPEVIVRTRPFLLTALFAVPFVAACVTKQEVVEPSPRSALTMVAINGTLNYSTGAELPSGAQVTVQALDASRAGSTPISESRWNTTGEQVPLTFTLPIDQVWFSSGKRLTIRATIQVDGRVAYTTASPYVTNGAVPPGPIALTLVPAR